MSRMKKSIMSLCFAICILLGLETFVRTTVPFQPNLDGVSLPPDPDLLWRQPYGLRETQGVQVRINKLGMRGPELRPKASDECRVVSIGDSSVFGFMVAEEESYTAVACQSHQCTPMILASPGYSTVQSLVWLERIGAELEPDWIWIGNLWSDQSIVGFQDKDLVRDYSVFRRRWQWRMLRIFRRSALFNQLRLFFIGDTKHKHRDVAWQNGWNQSDKGLPRVPLKNYAINIAALVTLSQSLGANVAFVGLAKQSEMDGAHDELAEQYRTVLKNAADIANAPYIDAKTVWQRSKQPSTALFADFLHPSAEGHRLLGEALAEEIIRAQGCD